MTLINSSRIHNFSIILFLLLPISIVLSKFFADLTVVILALFFILFNKHYYLNDNKKFYKNFFVILFFLFVSFSVISSLFSSNILISLKSSLFHFRFIFFSLSLGYLFTVNTEKNLKFFFYILLGCYLILIIDGTYQFIFKENLIGFVTNPKTRVSSFFFDELVLGSYLSRLFPILVFLYLFLKLKKNIIIITIFLISLYFVTFITGERLSFFILNIYYFLFTIYLIKSKLKKLFFVLSFILIFALTLNTSKNFNPRSSLDTITDQFTNFNYTLCEETKNKINSSEYLMKKWNYIPNCDPIFSIKGTDVYFIYSLMHFNHYISALEIFMDNKFIGVGPKSYRFKCHDVKYFLNEFSCSTHPHNYFLQILSETGLIGIFFFLTIYFSFFFQYLRELFLQYSQNSLLKLILLSSILINFFPLFPSGSFFNNWNSIIYTLPFGFLLGFYKYNIWK